MVHSLLEISPSQKSCLYWQVKLVKIHGAHDTYHMIASPLIYQHFFKVHVINYKLKNLSCLQFHQHFMRTFILHESKLSSFSLVTFSFVIFGAIISYKKCSRKTLMKLTSTLFFSLPWKVKGF